MSLRPAGRAWLAPAGACAGLLLAAGLSLAAGPVLAAEPPAAPLAPLAPLATGSAVQLPPAAVAYGPPPGAPHAPHEEAQAAFKRAEAASRDMRFQEALEAYEEVVTKDPTAPFAPTARVRAADLRDHAEGHFEPLAKLDAVRRDPAKNSDRASIEALERDARGFPVGRVRSEAMLVVSQAYEHRLGEPARALAALEAILTDPAADRGTRALALSGAVELYRAKGDLQAAIGAVSRDPDLLPNLTREVRTAVRRARIADVCVGALAVLAALGAWGGIRSVRRLGDVRALVPAALRPGAIAFAFYVGAGGAVFVRLQGDGDPVPFLLLGAAIVGVGAVVRLWAIGDPRRTKGRAALRAVVGVLGMLAVAYLILWRSNGEYLASLGL